MKAAQSLKSLYFSDFAFFARDEFEIIDDNQFMCARRLQVWL